MDKQAKKRAAVKRRHLRVRRKVVGTSDRPRLAVIRSAKYIYAQVVDDTTGQTIAAASTAQSKMRKSLKSTGNIEAAKAVGKEIANVAVSHGIREVCFDRGGRKYHGRVKALADAAREGGLIF